MRLITRILILILLSVPATAQTLISPKGDRITVDTSKWKLSGSNIYFKLSGNVGIGNLNPAARLVVDNGGSTSLQALKLKYPFSGATTDSILTWNSTDSSVRRISGNSFRTPLSGLLAATGTNTIDNLNLAQAWTWSTATTQKALMLTANSLTTGSLLELNGGSGLTSGSLLDVNGTVGSGTSAGLFSIVNSGPANGGTVAKVQANTNTESGLTILANGNVGIGTSSPFAGLTNNYATAYIPKVLGNFTGGGVIGTANATVDSNTNFNIAQTTAGQTLSLPSPTLTNAGRIAYVNNTGTVPFTMYGAQVAASEGITVMWNGTAWTRLNGSPTTIPFSGLDAATGTNTINNLNWAQTWNWNTATTQKALTMSGNALTTGSLLELNGGAPLTSGSLLAINGGVNASTSTGLLTIKNTSASSTGTVARIQANTTTTSGITILANGNIGVGTASPTFTTPANTGAAIPVLGVDGSVNASNYTSSVQTLTDAATIAWDVSKGASAIITLAGTGRTLSISNIKAGMYGTLVVKQDATGNRTITTLPSGSKVINGGAGVPQLSATANAADVLSFFYDGTNYWWTVGNNYN